MDPVAKKEGAEAKVDGENTIVIQVCDSVGCHVAVLLLIGRWNCSLPCEK